MLLSDARQPEVVFLIFGRCFCSDFWTSRLYNSKNTWKYKFGSVKGLENEKDLTSG